VSHAVCFRGVVRVVLVAAFIYDPYRSALSNSVQHSLHIFTFLWSL
jgi:hypothetical protein